MAMKAFIRYTAAVTACAAVFSLSGCGQTFFRRFLREEMRRPFSASSEVSSEEPVTENYQSPYNGELGSAGSLKGRTMIVSIYADDALTSWDSDSDEDSMMKLDTLDNLRISTEFLTQQAERYGSSTEFIWNWELNPDLCFTARFEESLVTEYGDMYHVQENWINENVDTEALKNRYRADNVIYLFFFNTDFSNQVNPWYLGYSCSPDYYIEFCNIYVRFDDCFVSKPSTYAHEMMHCFGAHDLYYANEFIPSSYVDHCESTFSNDIMYTVVDSKEITNDFSELDAYYVGLIDECADVRQWNLAPSEHIID